MDNKQGVQNIVDGMAYKPGWEFYLTWDLGMPRFNMKARMPNINNPKMELTLATSLVMPYPIGMQECKMWISNAIHYIEEHEHHEWLRFNGVQLFRPHSDAGDYAAMLEPLQRSNV